MSGSASSNKGQAAGAKGGVKAIPEGHTAITPYLMVPGAQKLIDFMVKAFGAEAGAAMKGPDGKIIHAEVKLRDARLMLGDEMEGHKLGPVMLYHYTENPDEVFKRALAAGASQVQEMKDQFYGDRAGAVTDPAGNTWWIGAHVEDVSHDELERRMKEEMAKMQKKT